MRTALLYALTSPWDAPMVLVALCIRVMWGNDWWTDRGVLWVRLAPQSWPSRTWYRGWAGTCLGHVVMLAHSTSERTVLHELHHTRQYRGNACAGFVLGLCLLLAGCGPIVALCVWALLPKLAVLGGTIAAWLEGGNPYRDAHHEASARSVSET